MSSSSLADVTLWIVISFQTAIPLRAGSPLPTLCTGVFFKQCYKPGLSDTLRPSPVTLDVPMITLPSCSLSPIAEASTTVSGSVQVCQFIPPSLLL